MADVTKRQIEAGLRSKRLNRARWIEQFGPDDPRVDRITALIERAERRLAAMKDKVA